MSLLLLMLLGCNLEKLPLTLDTADTAIVWTEPTETPPEETASVVTGAEVLPLPPVCLPTEAEAQ